MNPQKGYYATANNRIMPENSRFDIGATGTITPRAKRITEIIDKGIKSGQRFTSQDMMDIQSDVVDIVARDLTPLIIKISQGATINLSKEELSAVEEMISILKNFDGNMTPESIGASVYSYWHYFFVDSLFHD